MNEVYLSEMIFAHERLAKAGLGVSVFGRQADEYADLERIARTTSIATNTEATADDFPLALITSR